jgi:hypothetical protein
MKDADGKFSNVKPNSKSYSSLKIETRADKMWYLNLLEGNEESGNGLKDHVGQIKLKFMTCDYPSI